ELDVAVGKAEPLRAQAHLRHRLLSGNVGGTMFAAGERGCDLDQQRRFADAGIAAQKEHRAGDEAAARYAIEFGETGGEPRRIVRVACERFQLEQTALARRASGHLGALGSFLHDGVPFAARFALALPTGVGGAAVLADKAGIAAGHGRSPVNSSAVQKKPHRVTRLYKCGGSAVPDW